jgi:PAS domain S-box-containing protein
MQRQGRIQASWLAFSYLPVRDETSGVGGILCTVLDKTDRVQAERRLRFQIDLGNRLHGLVEPREIMAASAELLGRYLGVGRAGYAEVDATAEFFEVERDWTDGTMPSLAGRHRLTDFGPSITAGLKAGRAIRLDDVLSDPAAAGETVAAAFAGIHTRAGIAVPLMENGHVGAMLYVSHAEPRAWQDDEIVLLGEVVARTREAVGWARAEAARRDSEERFRLFAEHSTNVLWILNVEQDAIEYASPAFEQVLARPRDAMLGVPGRWIEPIHPEDQAGVREVLVRILRGEASVTHVFRILRPDGSVRWLRDTWFPIRGERAGLQRVAGIAQDITRDAEARVYVVDADAAGRERLSVLFRGAGYRAQGFATARSFLEVAPFLASGCVLLKVQALKAADSVALLQEIKERGISLPVVIVDGTAGDVGIAVRVMRAGAVDYQVDTESEPAPLLAAVAAALAEVQVEADRDSALEHARKVIAGLPLREREVLQGLLTGATNKEIARALGISPRTVELHRAHVMGRLGARTLPDAVLLAAAAGLKPFRQPFRQPVPER